ncbi:MAG: 6-phosphogluconolactonase, partial [Muribaculaceae bacterium]|nr:6-phosphogluconolactonase [Muribaculaceae bacterium]
MKTNLSSQIKLDLIPKRYYAPVGEIELATLTREEKIYTKIFESAVESSAYLADDIATFIDKTVARKGKCVLALGVGISTHPVYAQLIDLYNRGRAHFENVIVFNVSEFYPQTIEGISTINRLREVFLDKVNVVPENIHTINTNIDKEDVYHKCREYEAIIESCGGIDLTFCEIGAAGSLAFNGPGSQSSSACRLVLIDSETRHRIADDYKCENAPTTAITLGISNLLSARRVICMAWGENSSRLVKKTVEGDVTTTIPASFLQNHSHAKLVLDLAAAEQLTRISHPWKVTTCEWNDKITRRAIVWLCKKT